MHESLCRSRRHKGRRWSPLPCFQLRISGTLNYLRRAHAMAPARRRRVPWRNERAKACCRFQFRSKSYGAPRARHVPPTAPERQPNQNDRPGPHKESTRTQRRRHDRRARQGLRRRFTVEHRPPAAAELAQSRRLPRAPRRPTRLGAAEAESNRPGATNTLPTGAPGARRRQSQHTAAAILHSHSVQNYRSSSPIHRRRSLLPAEIQRSKPSYSQLPPTAPRTEASPESEKDVAENELLAIPQLRS